MKKKAKPRRGLEAAANFFDVPAEVAAGSARITITGSSRVLIENHCGILEYMDSRVSVNCRRFAAVIQGRGLGLGAMNTKELVVTGDICAVNLETAGEREA